MKIKSKPPIEEKPFLIGNKIYKYYYSKERIEKKLLKQQICIMRNELRKKHNSEEKNFNDIFYSKYPKEEDEVLKTKEANNYLSQIDKYKKIKDEKNLKKCEDDLENIRNKMHDSYIEKMGIEYNKEFSQLKDRFERENEEQKLKIKKLVFNKSVNDLENKIKKRTINRKIYEGFEGYFNMEKEDTNKDKMFFSNRTNSKIFRFYDRKKSFKTIIV